MVTRKYIQSKVFMMLLTYCYINLFVIRHGLAVTQTSCFVGLLHRVAVRIAAYYTRGTALRRGCSNRGEGQITPVIPTMAVLYPFDQFKCI